MRACFWGLDETAGGQFFEELVRVGRTGLRCGLGPWRFRLAAGSLWRFGVLLSGVDAAVGECWPLSVSWAPQCPRRLMTLISPRLCMVSALTLYVLSGQTPSGHPWPTQSNTACCRSFRSRFMRSFRGSPGAIPGEDDHRFRRNSGRDEEPFVRVRCPPWPASPRDRGSPRATPRSCRSWSSARRTRSGERRSARSSSPPSQRVTSPPTPGSRRPGRANGWAVTSTHGVLRCSRHCLWAPATKSSSVNCARSSFPQAVTT